MSTLLDMYRANETLAGTFTVELYAAQKSFAWLSLPQPASRQGSDYLARQSPRWDEFLELRRALEPKDTFLSTYWRRHLGIQ